MRWSTEWDVPQLPQLNCGGLRKCGKRGHFQFHHSCYVYIRNCGGNCGLGGNELWKEEDHYHGH